jgi:C4-dicarboxylate-specific signal transduction histidine kinase
MKAGDQETILIGKITAGLSHELMNVLAIIRERAGLIEDLMALDKETVFPFRDKLDKALVSIRDQVLRGMMIGEKLNQFAHSMDEPMVRVEIHPSLEQAAFLMQRFAGLKKVQIKVPAEGSRLAMETDPFRLLLVIAACIEYCLARADAGGEIRLFCQQTDHGAAIRCALHNGPFPPAEVPDTLGPLRSFLDNVFKEPGVRLEPLVEEDRTGLVLALPRILIVP